MFTLMLIALLNLAVVPEVPIVQAALIVLVSGSILYGSVMYFLQKMTKQIDVAQKEMG